MARAHQGAKFGGRAISYLPAAVALSVVLAVGIVADRQGRALARQTLRAETRVELEAIRSRVEVAMRDQVAALSRLAGALAAAPDMDHARFADIATALAQGSPMVRGLAAVPVGGGTMLYAGPTAPPLAAILAEAAPGGVAARSLAGPMAPLLVLSAPVHAGAPATAPRYWGHVATMIDTEALFAAAGLREPETALDLALTEGHALHLGSPAVLHGDPVRVGVPIPGGDWALAARPRHGWGVGAGAIWPIRLLTMLSVGLVAGPMLRMRRLMEERQRHISDLRNRETQLGTLSRRLGLALDASEVGVWDYNIDTDVLVWDDRMDALYGMTPDGAARSYLDWRGRVHPDDLERAEAEFIAAIRGTGRYSSTYRLVLPDGTLRHVHAIGVVYREAIDGTSKIVGVNRDVTEDVRRTAELHVRRQEAEAASVAKSQFLATMSHEIRTPMNGVIGMIDLLLRSRLDAEQRGRAAIARESAGHLLAILNDVLDFSKLEADRIALEHTATDVIRMARDVVALMSPVAEEHALRLLVSVDGQVPGWVLCDPKRLRQVLINLVGNAVKFTEKGSIELRLGYRPDGGVLDVAVRDTGVGIPEEARSRLFQRFAQVNSSITRRRGGTGLGLAISRQLVELMGGEIGVESVPGLGSTFRFWVPAPPAAAPEAGDDMAEGARMPAVLPELPPLSILVAEDNPTNQKILSAYLVLGGHEVRLVGNGAEALAEVESGACDLVIMDIQMPVMDGITAARRIRALDGPRSAIPIVALTANAMRGDRESYLAAGMTEYVSKPVAVDALFGALARAVRRGAAATEPDPVRTTPRSAL